MNEGATVPLVNPRKKCATAIVGQFCAAPRHISEIHQRMLLPCKLEPAVIIRIVLDCDAIKYCDRESAHQRRSKVLGNEWFKVDD